MDQISDWYSSPVAPLLLVDSIGGSGKSSLAWVWLHAAVFGRPLDTRLQGTASIVEPPEGVLWWSFYNDNSRFRELLTVLNRFLSHDSEPTAYLEEQLKRIVDKLVERRFLLILDGLERVLAAYDSLQAVYENDRVDEWGETYAFGHDYSSFTDRLATRFFQELAARGARSKLLLTTRLIPTSLRVANDSRDLLAGVSRITLGGLSDEACLEFFRCANVILSRNSVRRLCQPIGYHALYVRLLRGLLEFTPERDRGGISNLFEESGTDDHVRHRSRLLARAFEALGPELQLFMTVISIFRLPIAFSTLYDLVKARMQRSEEFVWNGLKKLEQRGLLYIHGSAATIDLHPIVRAYVYSRIQDVMRTQLHELAAINLTASNITIKESTDVYSAEPAIAQHFAGALSDSAVPPGWVDDARTLIEFFHQLIGAKKVSDAIGLYRSRLLPLLFFRLAAYSEAIGLLERIVPDDETGWATTDVSERVWLLNSLAMCFSRMALFDRARSLYNRAIVLSRSRGLTRSLAVILQNLSEDYWCRGDLVGAEALILESRSIAERDGDDLVVALSYRLRGFILNLSRFASGEEELTKALEILGKRQILHPQVYVYTNWAWGAILNRKPDEALRQLDKAEAISRRFQYARDVVRIKFLRGKALIELGSSEQGETILREALMQCRHLGLVEFEPNILVELARGLLSSRSRGVEREVLDILKDALMICKNNGLRIQEADVHMLLSEAARRSKSSFLPDATSIVTSSGQYLSTAIREARAAVESAQCNGEPYVYRRVYDDAQALLRILESDFGRPSRGTPQKAKGKTPRRLRSPDEGMKAGQQLPRTSGEAERPPTVFISYSWDSELHKEWVRRLAERLRADGVDVTLDRWHMHPGDQITHFMEGAVRENDYVLIICTPRYRGRSESRHGGVGYEGDIMTAEVYTQGNHRKFIPLLRGTSWGEAAPSWLAGKYYLDFTGDPYPSESYETLIRALHKAESGPPPVGLRPEFT